MYYYQHIGFINVKKKKKAVVFKQSTGANNDKICERKTKNKNVKNTPTAVDTK